MLDTGVPEQRAIVDESGLAVEIGRVRLCVETGMAETAPAGFVDERVQERRTDTAPARVATNGHATDLHVGRIEPIEPSRADGLQRIVERECVNGVAIAPVVIVDLFFGRNALFADEDRGANRERRA